MIKFFACIRFLSIKGVAFICLGLVSPLLVSAKGEPKLYKAESVGMSSERLQRINDFADEYIREGHYAGMVTMVARQGKVVHLHATGKMGLADPRPMQTDTLFRIYSMTKPVTAIAAMMLYEEGKFRMDDPVHLYLPEFKDQTVLLDGEKTAPNSPMTMRQLFTHTAGLTYGFTPDNPVDIAYNEQQVLGSKNLDEFVQKVSKIPLRFQPGTRYHYSVSVDVLGAAIERISGKRLDDFFQQRIFKPLGMRDTFFNVPAEKMTRLAGDHFFDANSQTMVPVPIEQQRNYRDGEFFSGGGGLVSTISDYMRFAQMVLNGGEYQSKRLLSPKTVEFLSANHLTPTVWAEGRGEYPQQDLYGGQSMALGFGVVTDPAQMPAISSVGEISWSGAAGTKFWIDPQEELIAIAMVQLYQSPWPLRFDLKATTYQAITELMPR
ncbi:MAG: beta-lactamase family protein [Acidiferrobacterales bacterium]|nr:beta-lactamase family protein [Acidiferrobacterales bacterium]